MPTPTLENFPIISGQLITVQKTYLFDAAHILEDLPKHDCGQWHGHGYKLCVYAKAIPDETGLVIDISELDQIVRPILKKLDHSVLNNVMLNPTLENVATYILSYLCLQNPRIFKVRLYQNENLYAEIHI